MLKFSIDLESIEDYKKPAQIFSFLSNDEIENKKNILSLLGKIAAKKAFFKSLGMDGNFKKIEVRNNSSGKPYIEIKDEKLKERLKNKKIKISISHTKDLAVAVCLIYE